MTTHAPEGQAPSTSPQYGGTPARNWALPLVGILVDTFLGAFIIPEIIFLVLGVRRHKRREGSYGWNMALAIVSGLTLAGYVLLYGVLVAGGVALSHASHTSAVNTTPVTQTAPSVQPSANPASQPVNANGCPVESGDVGANEFLNVVAPTLIHQRELAFTTGNVKYLNCFYKFSDSTGYLHDQQQIESGFRYQSLMIDKNAPNHVDSCQPNQTCVVDLYLEPNQNNSLDSHAQYTFEWSQQKQGWFVTEAQVIIGH